MIRETIKFINRHHLLDNVNKAVIALSGGADSMCLLHFMNEQYSNIDLVVAHFNHQLRPSADDEEEFCKKECSKSGIPFYSINGDVRQYSQSHKLSIEEAARILRYEFLFNIKTRENADIILTAHHLNDNGETIISNLLRGCGLEGLAGISPKENSLGRPLLNISKDEILLYCSENEIEYITDESNFDVQYKRNSIRHQLMPQLRQYNPNVDSALAKLADIVSEDNKFLDKLTTDYCKKLLIPEGNSIIIDGNELFMLELALQRRVVREAVNLFDNHVVLDYDKTDKILQLKTGKFIKISGNIIVKRDYNKLIIQNNQDAKKVSFEVVLKIGMDKLIQGTDFKVKCYEYDNNKINNNGVIVPAEYVDGRLIIRSRKPGDYFFMSNGNKKKLKEFFIDSKVSKDNRDRIPLLALGSNILWIYGFRKMTIPSNKDLVVVEIYHNNN